MRVAASIIKEWRENPCKFVWDNFKATPDAWQEEVLNSFANPEIQRIGMQACVGPGKTGVLAWCGWNFLACYGDEREHPKGAAVSVTGANLADNLWPELSKWQSMSPYLSRAFEWTKSRLFAKDHPETWFLSARSWSKTSNADEQGRTLSGLHSHYVLALIDESGDIPPAVAKAAEQALSTSPRFGKILQAGNPTSHTGILYQATTQLRHLWHMIRITGDPEDPKRSPRIDLKWAKEQIETYGRDNPWVMSSILGLFPPSGINTLLSPDDVQDAMERAYKIEDFQFAQKRLGIDVAREGDDRTVIFPRQGLVAFKPVEMRNAKSHEIAARVVAAKIKWASELECFDDTGGWAAGAIDQMIQGGYSPLPVNFSGKALDPRYFNKRSEMWFLMADWVKKRGQLPKDDILARELSAPTYAFKDGRFLLEPKEMIKKRLGSSPDKADALALTFALPEMPAKDSIQALLSQAGKVQADYDPFKDV